MATVTLSPGDDIQSAINNNPAGTTFNLSAGTYQGAQFVAQSNDQFVGDPNGGTVLDGGNSVPYLTYDNGATGVVLQNLTVQNYASTENGAIQTGQYWTLNNDTVQSNQMAGVTLGANSTIQGGHYIDNGQIGIDGYHADNTTVSAAEIANNNTGGYDTDNVAGGLKFSASANVTLENNNVHDNNGMGLWGDGDSSNWTISNNTISGNARPGIQYEISHGATIDGNTISNNKEAGIYISNSDGVEASGNTVTVGSGNTGFKEGGIDVINDYRDPSNVSTNENIQFNTIIHNSDTTLDGIYANNPLPSDANNTFANNTYDLGNPSAQNWIFGQSTYDWASLQQTQYAAGSSVSSA